MIEVTVFHRERRLFVPSRGPQTVILAYAQGVLDVLAVLNGGLTGEHDAQCPLTVDVGDYRVVIEELPCRQ